MIEVLVMKEFEELENDMVKYAYLVLYFSTISN